MTQTTLVILFTIAVISLSITSSQPVFADTLDLTGTIRDFHASHPDFEAEIGGLQTGQVSSTLGADKNPVFVEPSKPGFHGTANFNQWYNDVAGTNLAGSLTITLDNTITPDPNVYTFVDNSFFPIDGLLFGNEGNSHNYHFTYEIHTEFTYLGGETFSFTGDDDLWVFINDALVVDLGGVHGPVSGAVSLDTLGLTVGETYDFDLFFAERHLVGSNFRIDTSIVFIPQNTAPEAFDDSITTNEDTPVDGQANAVDADGDSLTYSLVSTTSNGVLVFNSDGSFTYTPNTDYNGPDSFTFRANDGQADSNDAVIDIDVIPVNDDPVCSDATSSVSTIWPPNHTMVTIDFDMLTADVDGDEVTLSILSIFQDEPTNDLGDGDQSPDADLVNAQVRAERSGLGDGRVYHVTVVADDGNGGTCEGTFTVGVPHDKKDTPVDSGATYDSTEE